MESFPTAAFLAALPFTALTVAVLLGATLIIALRVGKHAIVDIVWGLGFAAIAVVSYLLSNGHGDDGRRALIAALTVVWGVRLATHIGLRSRGHGEDPRYEAMLRKSTGNGTWYVARKVYLTQGVTMWFVSLPVQVTSFSVAKIGLVEWIGVVLWAIGFTFETVGDLQLTRFRNDPSTDGKVLNTGLWRYTRHPNYFGDACTWWGLSMVAFGDWPGILTILSPALMTWLLAKGTGKPLLEKDISERRPGYADYVEETSGFIPLPPKKHRGS